MSSLFTFFFFGGVLALPHRSDARTDFDRSWVIRLFLPLIFGDKHEIQAKVPMRVVAS